MYGLRMQCLCPFHNEHNGHFSCWLFFSWTLELRALFPDSRAPNLMIALVKWKFRLSKNSHVTFIHSCDCFKSMLLKSLEGGCFDENFEKNSDKFYEIVQCMLQLIATTFSQKIKLSVSCSIGDTRWISI